MDIDEGLKLCRQVRKDLNEMLANLQARDFFDIASDVGEMAKGGYAFDKMDEDLKTLELLLAKEDLREIGSKDWSICELVNFYDSLAWSIYRHPSIAEKEKLTKVVERWRDTSGLFAQMVGCMDDID